VTRPIVVVLGHFPDLARLLVGLNEVCELWLVADDTVGPLPPYERVRTVGAVDRSTVLDMLRAEGAADRVAAVVPGRERYTTLSATTARSLGVQPDLPDAYRTLEDKYLLRVASQAAGLSNTFFTLGETADDVAAALDRVGPEGVVVKPRRGNASRGVTHLSHPDDRPEIEAAVAVAGAEFLVEEFVAGAGFSVELVRDRGRLTFSNVTAKTLSGAAGASPFIPVQHTVPAVVDDALRLRLVAAQLGFLDRIGATTGLFHGEWQLRPDCTVYLIECAARFPGGGLGDAAQCSYGVNLAHTWVRALLGCSPVEPLPEPRGHTASMSFLAPQDGRLSVIHGLDAVAELPETLSITRRVADGRPVRRARDGSDRLLTVTVHAASGDALRDLTARVRALVTVDVD
jgi:biotin carboxylase